MFGSMAELTKEQEAAFLKWKATLPTRLQSEKDYDLRGFWLENPNWSADSPEAHMTDKFKLPNHPLFSVESTYYKPGMKAGYWKGEKYIPLKEGEKPPKLGLGR